MSLSNDVNHSILTTTNILSWLTIDGLRTSAHPILL